MHGKKKITSFYLESLGCAKNTVDSHSIERILKVSGYQPCVEPEKADIIIVNTCGFIQPAKEESLQVLREFARTKQDDQFLVAAGCLSERDKSHLSTLVDGLDAAISTRRWSEIATIINHFEEHTDSPYFYFPDTNTITPGPENLPRYAIQGRSAYLKIADGCDRTCAFCAIPLIKGPMISRSIEEILRDARQLEELAMQEVILIAQDSTAYGRDFGLVDGLPKLLTALTETAPGIPWIRIMYTFPVSISDDLIQIIRETQQIVPYLDIPLQHAHPAVLKRMRRPSEIGQVKNTLLRMRADIPGLTLRTTFIVGFPGETDAEYSELVRFVKEVAFDHVGIFPYYHESSTPSFRLIDDIPEDVKTERIQNLARIQEGISLKKNQSFLSKELQVLIEGKGDEISIGRSYHDAPEIDGLVFVQGIIEPGLLIKVRVTGAMTHDLIAERI